MIGPTLTEEIIKESKSTVIFHLIYETEIKVIFLVDISQCGLTQVSRVITWMTCDTRCWTVTGSDKIYNLTNDSFRVYLYHVPPKTTPVNEVGYPLRAEIAEGWNYQLHYEVKGICNSIPIE